MELLWPTAASIPMAMSVGPADQRSQIKTFNIAPSWTRLLSPTTVFTLGAFVRRDAYNYYPSANPFADLGAPGPAERNGQSATARSYQCRAALAIVSYVKGIHNIKVGVTYEQTFLDEKDPFGIVDPTLNAPCLDANGDPVFVGNPGLNDPSQCADRGDDQPNLYPAPFIANMPTSIHCWAAMT